MSHVLAIEPGRAQAELLREVHASLNVPLVVVASKDEAVQAIDREVPDLVLVNALLSPREENELVAHLRSLDNASHLQLLTIPLLSRGEAVENTSKSFFGFGKKRRAAPVADGCDLATFGEQVASYLARAQDVKKRPKTRAVAVATPKPVSDVDPAEPPIDAAPVYEPPAAQAMAPQADAAPLYEAPLALPLSEPASAEAEADVDRLFDRLGFAPAFAGDPQPAGDPIAIELAPEPERAAIDLEVSIDLDTPSGTDPMLMPAAGENAAGGIDVDFTEDHSPVVLDGRDDDEPIVIADPIEASVVAEAAIAETVTQADGRPAYETAAAATPHAAVVDFARLRAEAEAALTAELQRVQQQAAEQRERELAQWQAEAEALREATVGRAREEAETKARQALADEIQRVQVEAAQQRERELAQWQAEAEALRDATVDRARAEAEAKAREALAEELARTRAESDQVRTEEIARLQAEADQRLEEVTRQAREVAEAEAARALGEELARVRSEAEAAAARALDSEAARVRAEADARLQAELERVRRDAEEARRSEQAAALAEAERIREAAAREAREVAEAAAARALETELQRVRAEAEAVRLAAEASLAEQSRAHADASQAIAEAERVREAAAREAREIAEAAAARKLEVELERVRQESEARLREQQAALIEAEKARDAAAREARAIAETAAAQALEHEIRRVKAEADARLAEELAQLRADAERRRELELEEVRRHVEEMRIAAAEQARTAASEAVAAELARTAAQRGVMPAPKPVPVVRVQAAKAKSDEAPPSQTSATKGPSDSPTSSSSYYDLWRSEGSPSLGPPEPRTWVPSVPSRFRREPWMLPAAAAALLVICGGIGFSLNATAWASNAKKAIASAIPNRSEDAAAKEPAAPTTGDLLVETTPKGAEVTVDGKPRGKTPLTVTALSPGRHTVVLKSNDGIVIRRDVLVRVGERAVTSELMVTGWLTVNSPVPVDVLVGGRRIGRSGDQLTLSPGRHKVTFVSKHHNVRQTHTIDIRAGSIASHSLKLPNVQPPAAGPSDQGGAAVPTDPAQGSFDGLKVLSESAANPGVRKPRP